MQGLEGMQKRKYCKDCKDCKICKKCIGSAEKDKNAKVAKKKMQILK